MAQRDAGTPQLRHLKTALRAATDLRDGDVQAETLHRLRTHLRRIQAYLELIGDSESALKLGKCVSRSSRLRALQVFEAYLLKHRVSRKDLRHVRVRVKKSRAKLLRKEVYDIIVRRLGQHAEPMHMLDDEWISSRLDALRREHVEALHALHARFLRRPQRKVLHQIRLRIKTLRYQEEWVLNGPLARPALVERLKRIQSVLGAYEDIAQFRKWAKAWKLGMRSSIQKDWRVMRRRARAIGRNLDTVTDTVMSRCLRLVPDKSRQRG